MENRTFNNRIQSALEFAGNSFFAFIYYILLTVVVVIISLIVNFPPEVILLFASLSGFLAIWSSFTYGLSASQYLVSTLTMNQAYELTFMMTYRMMLTWLIGSLIMIFHIYNDLFLGGFIFAVVALFTFGSFALSFFFVPYLVVEWGLEHKDARVVRSATRRLLHQSIPAIAAIASISEPSRSTPTEAKKVSLAQTVGEITDDSVDNTSMTSAATSVIRAAGKICKNCNFRNRLIKDKPTPKFCGRCGVQMEPVEYYLLLIYQTASRREGSI